MSKPDLGDYNAMLALLLPIAGQIYATGQNTVMKPTAKEAVLKSFDLYNEFVRTFRDIQWKEKS